MATTDRNPSAPPASAARDVLPKLPTGVQGLDEVTGGGLPAGRITLICGAAGCGKTLLATQFLANGILRYGEPGVLVAFEETAKDLTENVRSLGLRLDDMVAHNQLFIDHVRLERSEIEETGEYDLEGLFIRLAYALDTVGAKRLVLDTIESLFGGFSNAALLRSELRRLFQWIKDRGVTAIVTGERGEGTLTRQGLEEYVSDCVILLDHRIDEQIATRRLRIVKYRGSLHGTNEYPFLIDENGVDVLPITSVGLDHGVSSEVVSSGTPDLDALTESGGFYRGSSIMVSGSAGTGKTSLAARFVAAACARGERCLYLAMEESSQQIVRNMRSIGVDLEPAVTSGLLTFHCTRPSLKGLEAHLVSFHKMVRDLRPSVVVLDPLTNFVSVGTFSDVKAMLVRLIDHLKSSGITAFFTSLTEGDGARDSTDVGLSSLIDAWISLSMVESGGERRRSLVVLKIRGMAHSHQLREMRMSSQGIRLLPWSPAMTKNERGTAPRSRADRPDGRAGGETTEAERVG